MINIILNRLDAVALRTFDSVPESLDKYHSLVRPKIISTLQNNEEKINLMIAATDDDFAMLLKNQVGISTPVASDPVRNHSISETKEPSGVDLTKNTIGDSTSVESSALPQKKISEPEAHISEIPEQETGAPQQPLPDAIPAGLSMFFTQPQQQAPPPAADLSMFFTQPQQQAPSSINSNNPGNYFVVFFETCVQVLTSPKTFFAGMPRTGGYGAPLLFAAVASAPYMLLCFGFSVFALFEFIVTKEKENLDGFEGLIILAFCYPVMLLIGLALLKGLTLLTGTHRSTEEIVRITSYSSVSFMISLVASLLLIMFSVSDSDHFVFWGIVSFLVLLVYSGFGIRQTQTQQ